MRKRRNFSPEFKAKVALAALKNEESTAELSARFEVNPTMISAWKKALIDNAAEVFGKGHKNKKNQEAHVEELFRQIGKLKVENDFLSKKLSL